MSTLVSSAPRALRGLLGAAVLSAAVTLALVPSAHAAGTEVSQAVFDKYNPAGEAYKQHNYAKALSLGKEALAASKSSFEKSISLKMMVGAAVGAQNYPEAISAIEQLISTEGVSAAEKLSFHKTLSQLYGSMLKYDKAIAEMKEYMKGAGGGAAADWDALARLYGVTKDCPNAVQALDKALCGKPGNEDQMKLIRQLMKFTTCWRKLTMKLRSFRRLCKISLMIF